MADNAHMWVEFNYLPVTVEYNEATDNIDVYSSDEGIEAFEETKMTGCWFCHTPLTHQSLNSECSGSPEQK